MDCFSAGKLPICLIFIILIVVFYFTQFYSFEERNYFYLRLCASKKEDIKLGMSKIIVALKFFPGLTAPMPNFSALVFLRFFLLNDHIPDCHWLN